MTTFPSLLFPWKEGYGDHVYNKYNEKTNHILYYHNHNIYKRNEIYAAEGSRILFALTPPYTRVHRKLLMPDLNIS
jgi:hypothetical protein